MREEQASLHERGMADHELIGEDEREHFEGTSAVPDETERGAGDPAGARIAEPRGGDSAPMRAADREPGTDR
jgi:hypothetical protein